MKRTGQSAAPAMFVALSVAVCLGAAVDVTASQTQRARAERCSVTLTAAEREALASLLACLSDTARQLKPDPQAPHAPLVPHRLTGAPLGPVIPAGIPASHDPLGPGTLARSHLLSLPPPPALL